MDARKLAGILFAIAAIGAVMYLKTRNRSDDSAEIKAMMSAALSRMEC